MATRHPRETLAIHGGSPLITKSFTRNITIGTEEIDSVVRVMSSGNLSQYLGVWHPDFYGGPTVQEFEASWSRYFQIKNSIAVNSWTSGLIAAVGALGIAPGDEIIVSPWTMSASATAILHWNAIPVFADIEPDTFCIDVKSIEENISPFTKAIIAVDIFGQSSDMNAIMSLASKYNLSVISDTAQSIGAKYFEDFAGTVAHVGGFSLNYHKHIHTGEGGMLVTNDDQIAERLRLIRNHAEAVVGPKGETNLTNMIGYNFRLGEIESAIGIEQLKKLDTFILEKSEVARRLNAGLANLEGLNTPVVRMGSTHVYYVYAIVLDIISLGVPKRKIFDALIAEGVPSLSCQYQNLHLLPMYQNKIAYGRSGFPWSAPFYQREVSYQKGICPVAERLQDDSYLGISLCEYNLSPTDVDLIIAAFQKVWANINQLRQIH